MISASKKQILDKIPQRYIPKTKLLSTPFNHSNLMKEMKEEGFTYPVIFKPDLGERGWKVERISNEKEAKKYLESFDADLQIQEFIDLPLEAGVFYYRFPGEERGKVSSIVIKELLFVLGDGESTLEQLIIKKPRARLQFEKLRVIWKDDFENIPTKGERMELQPIGNHNRGTAFLNGNHLIGEELTESFEVIRKSVV